MGIGVGSVELELERHTFAPGDRIDGTLILKLDETTSARRLMVGLIAKRDRMRVARDKVHGDSFHRYRDTVHRFEYQLVGEQIFVPGETRHGFSLKIPSSYQGMKARIQGEGTVSNLLRIASTVASTASGLVQWKVFGYLDLPLRRNLKKKVDIIVD
jgi:hypothetical protein